MDLHQLDGLGRAALDSAGYPVPWARPHDTPGGSTLVARGPAEKADLHRTYIGGIERGERNPSSKSLARILRGLGANWRELGTDSIGPSSSAVHRAAVHRSKGGCAWLLA